MADEAHGGGDCHSEKNCVKDRLQPRQLCVRQKMRLEGGKKVLVCIKVE